MPKFDFDEELISGIVLGDLPSDCPNVRVTPLYEPTPFKPEMVLGLSVEATVVSTKDVLSRVVREILVTKTIPDREIDQEAWKVYIGIARKLAPHLYEADPRIGLPQNGGFPDCPLFDPPYVVESYRTYLGNGFNYETPIEILDAARILRTCPLCNGGMGSQGVWGGGNLAFVHRECAPWIVPKT